MRYVYHVFKYALLLDGERMPSKGGGHRDEIGESARAYGSGNLSKSLILP